MIGNSFDPAIAGVGTHTITYSYSDGTCTGYAQDAIVVELCTNMTEQFSGDGIIIAPNPNGGMFVLTVAGPFVKGAATLLDASGKVVMGATKHAAGANALGHEGLSPGVYTLRVECDGRAVHRKVVVGR